MVDILCLGEMLVEIMRAEVDVPHSVVGKQYLGPYPSGAPVIFISSAARMGSPANLTAGYIGVVGKDDFGKGLMDTLQEDQVVLTGIRESPSHTGVAFNQYNSDGNRSFIFCAGAAGETSPEDVKKELFEGIKALHIMGSALSISESSRDACYKAVEIAKEVNPDVCISLDPNLRPEMLPLEEILHICKPILEAATIILPSGEEAEMLAQVTGEIQACEKLLELYPQVEIVVLKQGKAGATAITREATVEVPSYTVKEVDATGAGDSFGGAFIVEHLLDKPLRECLSFANAVGALKVTHFGPIPRHSREEVEKFMEKSEE